MAIITKAKDLFNKNIEISVGDIVTIDDDNDTVEASIVRNINGSLATICSLRITDEKDDVFIDESEVELSTLIYIGEPFINVNGYLWKVRERILKQCPNINPIKNKPSLIKTRFIS